jgi:hypothetical protein
MSTGASAPAGSGTAKTRLLAIAPTSQPNASAASAAVWTESGRMTMSPAPPRSSWADRKTLIEGCSVATFGPYSGSGGGGGGNTWTRDQSS